MNNLEELREHCEEMMAISPLRYAYIPASSIITLIERIEKAETALSAANEKLLVPGVLHCAKCSFQLTKTNLYMASGTTGPGDIKTEPCPNGCGPLCPVTWEQWSREIGVQLDRYFDEAKEMKAKLSKPVVLPLKSSDAELNPREYPNLANYGLGYNDAIDECATAIKAGGFTVEGE